MGLFSSGKKAPQTCPTDRIVPLSHWDDLPYARAISLDITLKFDDVLDPEKLRSSLETLLQKENWYKFGARLRRNENNKLEYHIPSEFSAERPIALFSTEKYEMTLSQHAHFSQLPVHNAGKPSLYGPFEPLRPLLRAVNAPECLDDWLYTDNPQLAVHVIVLDDATLLTVTFLHTLMDAMGFASLLKGWTAVLRGEMDQIPKMIDADVNPAATIHELTPASKYILADRVLKGWKLLLFVILYICESFWGPKTEDRLIFVPENYLKELRDSVLLELKEDSVHTSSTDEAPFVSESDVLLSWWTRVFLRALGPSPNRPITLMNVFDIRGVLMDMGFIPSSATAFIGNVTWPSVTLTTAGEVLGKPLSHLAGRIRRAVNTHRTQEQVQAIAAGQKESYEKGGRPLIFGEGKSLLLTCSNWNKGKIFQMDFSSAIIKKGVSQHASLKGPTLVFSNGKFVGFSPRHTLAVMGKDAYGNWWMRTRSSLWSQIEDQF